jgi:hypothetical protein
VKEKNSAGLKKAHLDGKMRKGGFTQEDRKKSALAIEQKLSSLPFEQQSWERQRSTVIAEQDNKCLHCGIFEWMSKPITLQVDHIDGNNRNNSRSNLRALCPNCHSNTETYCGKNINKHNRVPVPDETIIEEIKKGLSIRQVLINVGLTPKGGNYGRIKKLIVSCGFVKQPKLAKEPRPPRVPKEKYDICLCGNRKEVRNKHCTIKCASNTHRKVDWGSIDLKQMLADNNDNYCAVGRLLGVSDNTIRKHLKDSK